MRTLLISCLLTLLATTGGCGFDVFYAFHAVGGQANILFNSVPVEDAIADDSTQTETRNGLEYITELRAFARDEVRLTVDTSFTSFFDAMGGPVSFSVSAAETDSLTPLQWTFPFFGVVPFLNYFDRPAADAKVAELEAQGYDTFLYELDAYSLAVLPNPVLSPMLDRDEVDLATLVFHELTHRTVGRRDDGTDLDNRYNESVATFVGRRAALDYFEKRDGEDSMQAIEAAQRYDDDDIVTAFMLDLADQLEALYATDMPDDETAMEKARLFEEARMTFSSSIAPMLNAPQRYGLLEQMPDSNAFVLLYQRYNERQDLFAQVYEANGRAWGPTLSVYQFAAADEGDPFAYLENWLAAE